MMGPPDNNHVPPVFWTRNVSREGRLGGAVSIIIIEYPDIFRGKTFYREIVLI